MRRFFFFVFEGPKRPWGLTPALVVFYPTFWAVYSRGQAHAWVWLTPWLLILWWQTQRFLEVAHYTKMSRREFDWTCPVCRYPLAKLRKDFDPRTSRCPECGTVPMDVMKEARAKLQRAAKW